MTIVKLLFHGGKKERHVFYDISVTEVYLLIIGVETSVMNLRGGIVVIKLPC